MRQPWLALALGLALSGCSLFGGGARDVDLPDPPDASDYRADTGFASAWHADAGELPDDRGYGLVPAVAGDRIFIVDADGVLRALAADTGKPVWTVALKRPVAGGPGSNGTLVAVGTRDGKVIGIDAQDGKVLWISGVTSEVQAPPRVGEGLVVARSIDGRTFGLDAATGRRLWLYEETPPVLTLRGSSTPALVPGQLVAIGRADGKLAGLAPEDGKLLWETAVAVPKGHTDLERMVDIAADPVFYRGDVYAVAYQGRIAAVDVNTGRPRWDREMSAYAGLAVDATRVYVTASDNRVWALDRYSGASVWRHDDLRGLRLTGPAVVGDYVVVGDNEGYLNWLDAREGKLVRRQSIGGAFVAAPVVAGETIYLLTTDGLTALR